MNTQGVDTAAIVKVDKRGRKFFAMVVERDGRNFAIEPLSREANYRHCTSSEIIGIWRPSKATIDNAVEAVGGAIARRIKP